MCKVSTGYRPFEVGGASLRHQGWPGLDPGPHKVGGASGLVSPGDGFWGRVSRY